MALVDHNYMVKALAANRTDDPLDVGILPGRSRRRNDLCDPVCGKLLILAENTSEAQSCESFTYH